jgi:hypothetical protein
MRLSVDRGELVLALVFAALAVLWIAKGASMPLWQGFAPDSGFLPLIYGVRPGEAIRKPLVILGALIATVAALPVAGFAASIFALLLFLYAAVERLPVATSMVVSGTITGVLYLVFKTWLGVPLP